MRSHERSQALIEKKDNLWGRAWGMADASSAGTKERAVLDAYHINTGEAEPASRILEVGECLFLLQEVG